MEHLNSEDTIETDDEELSEIQDIKKPITVITGIMDT